MAKYCRILLMATQRRSVTALQKCRRLTSCSGKLDKSVISRIDAGLARLNRCEVTRN